MQGKYARDEIFAQDGILQAAVFLHGQQRHGRHKCLCKNATTRFNMRMAVVLVHLDAEQATAW